MAALTGRAVILEHPAESWRAEAASVWKTALIRMLTGPVSPFRIATFRQWDFGATSAKPTSLLVAHVELERCLTAYKLTWQGRPSMQLAGVDRFGNFLTSRAKECPEILCRVFASALHSRLEVNHSDTPAEWHEAALRYAALCKDFGGSMLPDYQPAA